MPLPNLGGPSPHFPGPSESSFAILQHRSDPHYLPIDFDHHVVLYPTRRGYQIPTGFPVHSPSCRLWGQLPAVGPKVPMVRQPNNPREVPTEFDHHFVMFPTRYATYIPSEFSTKSPGGPAFGVLPTLECGDVVWAVR